MSIASQIVKQDRPVDQNPDEYLIWTDGACKGNPGPGGWAAIVVPPAESGQENLELSGGDPDTTNNRMEFQAAIEGLKAIPAPSQICIVTDSKLLLQSMTEWIDGWRRKGWKTAAGKPVKNQDLLLQLDELINGHSKVRWHWVKGHETGSEFGYKKLNDRADELAVAAAAAAHNNR